MRNKKRKTQKYYKKRGKPKLTRRFFGGCGRSRWRNFCPEERFIVTTKAAYKTERFPTILYKNFVYLCLNAFVCACGSFSLVAHFAFRCLFWSRLLFAFRLVFAPQSPWHCLGAPWRASHSSILLICNTAFSLGYCCSAVIVLGGAKGDMPRGNCCHLKEF